MKTRGNQERMLQFVCGIDKETLSKMTDAQIEALYKKHIKSL